MRDLRHLHLSILTQGAARCLVGCGRVPRISLDGVRHLEVEQKSALRAESRLGMFDAISGLQTFRKRHDMTNDQAVLETLGEILQGPAIEIRTASSGAELVVLLAEQGTFDLIVTDIDMPWMEGLAVIRSARAAEIEAPVLFISAISRSDLLATVERLGNAILLRKPVTVSSLRQTVREMLGGVS
jgi:CheY-like chemotaxis protein